MKQQHRGPERRHNRASRTLVALAAMALGGLAPVQAATLSVDTDADAVAGDGACSLREAVINANANDQSGSPDCAGGEAAPVVGEIVFAPAAR